MDAFHIVQLAQRHLADLRRRLTWKQHGRRARKGDSIYTVRKLLRRGTFRSIDDLRNQVLAFIDALRLFKIGYSWGGVTSLAMTYDLQSPKRPAYGSRLVRLYTGLEAIEDLVADVKQALVAIG